MTFDEQSRRRIAKTVQKVERANPNNQPKLKNWPTPTPSPEANAIDVTHIYLSRFGNSFETTINAAFALPSRNASVIGSKDIPGFDIENSGTDSEWLRKLDDDATYAATITLVATIRPFQSIYNAQMLVTRNSNGSPVYLGQNQSSADVMHPDLLGQGHLVSKVFAETFIWGGTLSWQVRIGCVRAHASFLRGSLQLVKL